MEEQKVIRSLSALAQEIRLRVFRALVVAGPDGMTPGALAEALGVAPTTLSFHLKELSHAGLIVPTREGRHLVYRADYAQMNALLGYLTENCCRGASCAEPAAPVCRTC
ncbi:helix-turn-helix domain-containing protein [Methyloversatilis sp. XJ19-13]|uniref:ArsR/SmtB family transcription factor n=1 Tax=Methyloversatilis sp. XJ19-13 TaxID=2963430 RepID=UPI00211BAE86|nr:metalloregulator ArsR/SmtB family transcription factor [Methyloversatilis sp. XJ19-13]MCQ9373212.1 helix-turn-helix domain-containing protein [Methyloversatilis sp. XJ19-13]